MANQESLLKLLQKLNEVSLVNELNSDENKFQIFLNRTEESWKANCVTGRIALYTHLHPPFITNDKSIVSKAFLPLGKRAHSTSKSTTRNNSIYSINTNWENSEVGVLDEFKLDKLKKDVISTLWTVAGNKNGTLGPWSGEATIQSWVRLALEDWLLDCWKA
jgi:hypothetical protein